MKTLFGASAATVALLVAFAQPSHATLMLSEADNLGHSLTATGVGDLVISGPLGNFLTSVTTGLSKPTIGSATNPDLDLNSVDVASTAGGTLTLELTDTDFTGGGAMVRFLSAIGGTQGAGGTLTYNTFMDCTNTAFGQGTSLSSQSFSGGGGFSGNGSNLTPMCAGPYSLTEEVTLTLPASEGPEVTSFDANLSIPEPSTIASFGVGLLALGFALRRKGQQAGTAA